MRPLPVSIMRAAALAFLSALVLTACISPESVTSTAAANQPFACCTSGDVSPTRHPGETVKLHWIATITNPTVARRLMLKNFKTSHSLRVKNAFSSNQLRGIWQRRHPLAGASGRHAFTVA